MKHSVLGRRFDGNGRPVLTLNGEQVAARAEYLDRLERGEVKFESVTNCPQCGNSSACILANEDRYGLPMVVVSCTACGLLRTHPRMTQESYSDFYSKEYRPLYVGKAQATESFFDEQYIHGVQIYSCVKPFLNKPIEDILVVEVGVGAGGILRAFREAGTQVVGCDLGSDYLEYGRLVHGLDLRYGFFEDLQLDRNPDLVIYSHVLEHVLDPVAEMRKVACALGQGGLVYIEVPGVRSIPHVYLYDFLKYIQSAHTFHFTKRTLENLMEKAGYRCLQSDERVCAVFVADDNSLAPSLPYIADDVVGQLKRYERLRPFVEVRWRIKLFFRRIRHKVYGFLGMKSTAEKKALKRRV